MVAYNCQIFLLLYFYLSILFFVSFCILLIDLVYFSCIIISLFYNEILIKTKYFLLEKKYDDPWGHFQNQQAWS